MATANLNSIGKKTAIDLAKTEWWKVSTPQQIVKFQLFTTELCCTFSIFHSAVEEVLKRPVYTHEFGLNLQGLQSEFLGESPPPTLKEILDLIPEDKRMVLMIKDDNI